MTKSKELSGFEQMMEDIRTGNHRGGLVTPTGWADPRSSKRNPITKTPGQKPASKATNNASKAALKSGSKRAHSAIEDESNKENQGGNSSNAEINDNDPRLKHVTDDCDQLRERIKHFISRGEMTVTEFVKALDVSENSYLLFMDHNGPESGSKMSVYERSWRFFKRRELNGIPMPPHKIQKRVFCESGHGRTQSSTTNAPKKSAGRLAVSVDLEKYDISGITLLDEDSGDVEIYETCDSLRAIIADHLEKDDVVQSAFLREVSKCFGDNPKKITGAQLKSFMTKNGPHSGSSAAIFYGAYVYFEKLRVKIGEAKSEFREEMEDLWSYRPYETQRGFPRKGNNQHYIVRAGQEVYEDEYGRPVTC